MKKIHKDYNKEILLLFFLIIAAILIRSLHFQDVLNFMQDQATESSRAISIFRTHKYVLIGPPTAYTYAGRRLFQGPLITYTYLFFLLVGNFDPIHASYAFMVFACLMTIPLYVGSKLLFNKRTAAFVVAIYAFLPYYIHYTRFMWNPNFQFVLTPLLIFMMGLYKRTRSLRTALGLGVVIGALLQYHFQFVLVTVITFVWFIKTLRENKALDAKNVTVYVVGFLLGWSPYILSELRNYFYNIQTIVLFVTHFKQTVSSVRGASLNCYGLSLSLVLLPFVIEYMQKRRSEIYLYILVFALFGFSVTENIAPPTHAFLYSRDWRIDDELNVHKIIRESQIMNFQVTNLDVDNISDVQKYLMLRDRTPGLADSYRSNSFLFAVASDPSFKSYSAYEIRDFTPRKLLKRWQINKSFSLYLLQRI